MPLDYRMLASALLFFVTYAVSAWAFFEELNGIEWLTIVPFPALYATSVSIFYFLLPENLLSKIVVLVLFGIGMYATYLTGNIFSVAKFRTIQLLRAAHAIGFLMTLLISFFFTNTIFSFHWPFWANGIVVMLTLFPLAIFSLWSIELKQKIESSIFFQSVMIAVLMGELAVVVSFLPTTIWTSSLLLVGSFYAGLGILISKLHGRLFQNTAWEYLSVWLVIATSFFVLLVWK